MSETKKQTISKETKSTTLDTKQIFTSINKLREITNGLTQFNESLAETSRIIYDISKYGFTMTESFSNVADSLKNLKNLKQDKSSASETASISLDTASAAQNISNADTNSKTSKGVGSIIGDTLTGIGAVAGIAGSIIGIFKKRKEEEKKYRREMEKALYAQITAETQLSIATAQRLADEKSITREKYKQIEASRRTNTALKDDVINDINAAIDETEKKLNGRYSSAYKRTERDFQNALLKLKNNASDLDWLESVGDNPLMAQSNENYDQYMSYYNRLLALARAQEEWKAQQEALVEETIGSTANELVESWVVAFEKGEAATWDFAQNFSQVMRQAIINGFSDSIIMAQIEPIFNSFKEKIADFLSGKLELEDVITPDLEAQIEQTSEKIKKLSPELEKILEHLGLEISGNSSSLSASIQGVSEDTATAVAGQMNAIRSNQIKSIEYLTDSITIMNKIETNTRYCRYLESIDNRMDSIISALSFRVHGL